VLGRSAALLSMTCVSSIEVKDLSVDDRVAQPLRIMPARPEYSSARQLHRLPLERDGETAGRGEALTLIAPRF
jgi:hypothetical protein